MARRRGPKYWDGITLEGWLSLFGNAEIITDLMMDIFAMLYDAPDHTSNGKAIAERLRVEYRALNAAVGWAGNKIKDAALGGRLPLSEALPSAFSAEEDQDSADVPAPWEYVFNGEEDENGVYLWIMKPACVTAFRELLTADISMVPVMTEILSKDASSFGAAGNLFAKTPGDTVESMRAAILERHRFFRASLKDKPCCVVCGCQRVSLLRAIPYGEKGLRRRGLLFCPTHGVLFAAHLISFSDRGRLLLSPSLSEEDRGALGLSKGMEAKVPFSGRRMAEHRRIFNQEEKNR